MILKKKNKSIVIKIILDNRIISFPTRTSNYAIEDEFKKEVAVINDY